VIELSGFIVYDHRLKKEVLGLFGKELNSNGYIIQKNTKELVLAKNDVLPIHIDNFAGIEKGSEVFIRSDITSLIEYVEEKTQRRK
jgi:hypothetical protein